jgi:hypothetical protein
MALFDQMMGSQCSCVGSLLFYNLAMSRFLVCRVLLDGSDGGGGTETSLQ